jgi:hypothetical protein
MNNLFMNRAEAYGTRKARQIGESFLKLDQAKRGPPACRAGRAKWLFSFAKAFASKEVSLTK